MYIEILVHYRGLGCAGDNMQVTRINYSLDPKYPHQYCIRFDTFDSDMMYAISEYVRARELNYWVGCLTGVVYVPTERDVTFVQLQWSGL